MKPLELSRGMWALFSLACLSLTHIHLVYGLDFGGKPVNTLWGLTIQFSKNLEAIP